MTIYTEHDLRAIAVEMRSKVDSVGVPDRLKRKLSDFVNLIDGAADGKVSQESLQAGVDQINLDLACDAARRREMEDVSLLVDQALEEDDPGAWRDAMLRWLPLLPEDYVRTLMTSYAGVLDAVETLQEALDLVEMPPATEMRQ